MKFQNAGFYFIVFFFLAFVGFWPSYFSKFFDGTADFNQYFHFHVTTALSWVIMLVVQPLLIRAKKFELHRFLGRFSYVLVPVLLVSILLLANNRISPDLELVGPELWIPFKDLLIFGYGYGVAIWFRHSMPIHSRGMIVAGLAFLEPVLVRITFYVFEFRTISGYILGISVAYVVLLVLIILERNQRQGRWVFPIGLAIFFAVHYVRISGYNPEFWERFSRWFIALPLT